MTDQRISYQSRVLYTVISAHVPRESNSAYVGFRRLAKMFEVSTGTIFTWLKELTEFGHLQKIAAEPGKRGWFLLKSESFPQPKVVEAPKISVCARCNGAGFIKASGFCVKCAAEADKERVVKEVLAALNASGSPATMAAVIAYLRDQKDHRKFAKTFKKLGVRAA